MSDVIHRTTLEHLRSVNTPDYPTSDWITNPDLSGVASVPKKYWKTVNDDVLEMTQAEKDDVDAANLASSKVIRKQQVDDRTVELIREGFTWDAKLFSLSDRAQMNWADLKYSTDAGIVVPPVEISTMNDTGYTLATTTDVADFYTVSYNTKQEHVSSGRGLKEQIDAATTQAELAAIVDTR